MGTGASAAAGGADSGVDGPSCPSCPSCSASASASGSSCPALALSLPPAGVDGALLVVCGVRCCHASSSVK